MELNIGFCVICPSTNSEAGFVFGSARNSSTVMGLIALIVIALCPLEPIQY
jgi:hypothetical protein